MKNVIEETMENQTSLMASCAKDLSMFARVLAAMGDIAELSDVSSVSVWRWNHDICTDGEYTEVAGIEVTFYLKNEHADSKLVHKLTQRFGVEFTKEPNYDGQSLRARGDSKDGLWRFDVAGYVPATCELVTEEIPLTEEELALARANVPLVRKQVKVVCG